MVGLKRSRLTRSIDSSNDVKHYRNAKRNFEVDYFTKESVRRDLRVIEDSMKELEHSDLGDVDSEYFEYLTSDLMSARTGQDKKAININGTENDPQYDMFLSCLKPYGTSCILEVSETNGLSVPIIYGLDESDELLNKKAEGKLKNVVNRVLRSHNKRLISSKDCSVNSDGSDSLFSVGLQKEAVKVHGRYPLRSNNKVINKKKVEAEGEFMRDGDYALFLSSNLIGQDGPDGALVCEANKRRRFRAKSSEEEKRYALRSEGNVIETRKGEACVKKNDEYEGRVEGSKVISRDQPHLKGKKKLFQSDDDTCYVNGNGVCFAEFENSDDVMVDGDVDGVDTRVDTKCENVIGQDSPDRVLIREANKLGRSNANSSKEGKTYPLRSKDNVIKTRKVEASEPCRKNDKYADLCTGLSVEDSKVISRDQPDLKGIHEPKNILYQSDDDTYYVNEKGVCFLKSELSDDVIVVEDDDESVYTVYSHGEISSDFRKDLIDNLRKPYNNKELEQLYDQISARKLIDRHIDLRHGRAASYSGKKEGKSYLDQHFVLRRKLEGAEDDYEKLNLLRGFFFWLQNLTRDHAFEPWNDTACLAVLPQAVRKRKQQI